MLKYSVNDKLSYNKSQKTPFSYGYRLGVKDYREYAKSDKARRAEIKENIAFNSAAAKGEREKLSVQCAKGYMCAIRDCAEERKNGRK